MAALGSAKVTASGLNVRKGAGTKYSKIGQLTKGTKVNYYAETDGWLQIRYSGKTGYISKQYTKVTKATSNSGSSSSKTSSSSSGSSSGSVTITSSSLNIRSQASSDGKVVGSIPKGKTVSYTAESNGWLKISYNGVTGWISKKYTSPASKSSSSSSKSSSSKSSSSSGKSASAGNGKKLNPHTKNYKQYANPWGPKMYSSCKNKKQTYANSACGPTACASVIAKLANSSVTPYTLGQWALKFGTKYRRKKGGTKGKFVSAVCAKYGLSCSHTSVSNGIKKLQAGKYGIACMRKGYWTKYGHYITPYASDGKTVYVDDPGHASRPKGFKQSVKNFKKECTAFWVIG